MNNDADDERSAAPASAAKADGREPGAGSGEAGRGGGGKGQEPPVPNNPATPVEKGLVALFLFAVTVVLLLATWWVAQRIDEPWRAEVQVQWLMPQGTSLKPGPVSFWYDPQDHLLIHRGPVDEETRDELLQLIQLGDGSADTSETNGPTRTSAPESQASGDAVSDATSQSYRAAIVRLAFRSNQGLRSSIHWLPRSWVASAV